MDLTEFELTDGALPSEEMAYARIGRLGLVVLDRPRAINSLTMSMVASLRAQLEAWRADPEVGVVALTGAGERGFCAGGDVVAVRRALLAGGAEAAEGLRFFDVEYALDGLLATYPKPVVTLIEGVTMGGGIGLAGHAAVRLADPGATLAMPETIIGFFNDVGARALLAACPGEIGVHLAMTSASMTGADAVAVGFADAVTPAERFGEILRALADGAQPVAAELGDPTPQSALLADREWIDECYAGDDAAQILARLEAHAHPHAQAAAEQIAARSPFAVTLALAGVRAAAGKPLATILAEDVAIAHSFAHEPDFVEGVRAQLVDKDRRPHWRHASLADVDPAEVRATLEGRR